MAIELYATEVPDIIIAETGGEVLVIGGLLLAGISLIL